MKVNIKLENIKLNYFCPECNHEFSEYIWTNLHCSSCNTELETDFFEDEAAGLIGLCRTIISDTEHSISLTKC